MPATTLRSSPEPLEGVLYFLSLASSLVIVALASTFFLGSPDAGDVIFGIPIGKLAFMSDKRAGPAYISIIGVRDLTLAFISLTFTLLRDRRGTGVAKMGGIVATIGDAFVIYNYSDAPLFYLAAHFVPCIPLIALTAVLLGGSTKSVKARQ